MRLSVVLLVALFECCLAGIDYDLFEAARTNNVEDAKKAVEAGANVNARGEGGRTPLMAAVLEGSEDMVDYLLQNNKVDASIGEENGYTPMHGAGFQGRANIARKLIEFGLDANPLHEDGYRPIHRACWGGTEQHTDTVKVFLEEGKVDPNTLGEKGDSPLDECLTTNTQTAILLRSKGAKTGWDVRNAVDTEDDDDDIKEDL
eukprot:TRINITY_DN14290_c0_g1_i1.p1 TRINITY_DN14290_c0_g1~~TRINITY_DN14290_c0_g1_i1.p1  ORF type:complete len:211 (+),score=23.78 TRINITY_DN14290_c0_g1_i1:25-633(+)